MDNKYKFWLTRTDFVILTNHNLIEAIKGFGFKTAKISINKYWEYSPTNRLYVIEIEGVLDTINYYHAEWLH